MEQTKQYEYVDLGLPSGLKWAKCNVGAETETDYGYYFQWGSTTPNTADECTWTNAPFNGGYSEYNDDYFTSHKSEWLDDIYNLKPEFDAATQIMGVDWRMPTDAELYELINNTTNEWVTNYNGTDVNGRKFIGSNGNSIFIPAAGYCYDGSVSLVGYDGYVWSSSLITSYHSSAWYLDFCSDNCLMFNYDRNYGFVARGITSVK